MSKILYKNIDELKAGEVETIEIHTDSEKAACKTVAELVGNQSIVEDLFKYVTAVNLGDEQQVFDRVLYEDNQCMVIYYDSIIAYNCYDDPVLNRIFLLVKKM